MGWHITCHIWNSYEFSKTQKMISFFHERVYIFHELKTVSAYSEEKINGVSVFQKWKFFKTYFWAITKVNVFFFKLRSVLIWKFEFTDIFGIEEFGLIWPSVFLGQNLSDSSRRKNNQTHIRASQNNIISWTRVGSKGPGWNFHNIFEIFFGTEHLLLQKNLKNIQAKMM